ncbi:MAG: hypothetical protein ACYSUM_24530 [Planctomycetota bacterium]|jgi:phosphate transport system substrate-binding protein
MRFSNCVLCVALLVSSAGAQELEVDPSLPRYRPVAGVVGVIKGHGSRAMDELMTTWAGEFQRIYASAHVELDDAGVMSIVGGAATYGPTLVAWGKSTEESLRGHFGYAPARIPVCLNVLAVYVHKDNPCREGLLIEEVETTFSSAFKDRVWGDLDCRGEWSKRPITLYVPGGRRSFWARCLLWDVFDIRFEFKASAKRQWDDADVVSAVAKDTHGIGVAVFGFRPRRRMSGVDRIRCHGPSVSC